MTARSASHAILFALVVACSGTAASPVSQTPAAASGQRRALLVGVADFVDPAMQNRWKLEGPVNDVELFKRVLEPLGVPAANVTTLAGLPADVRKRPTRANIQREFARLADVSTRGDQVVILMAGHGSQQPANPDPTDDEPDGLDEIFLPADAAGWDGGARQVKNAIVDDDIRAWVTAIRNKGAFVWIIFDSCQSGTMTRGVGEVSRQIPMSELVPKESIAAAPARGVVAEKNLLGLDKSAAGIAALYAANMIETTPEKSLPDWESPVHGLFTYTIADVLSQSTGPLTYRDLIARVTAKYHIDRLAPNPMSEGEGLDREVLGYRVWPDRPQMVLSKANYETDWDLDAGTVQGVTKNSILEVFPPAGSLKADVGIGYVQVRKADTTTSKVFPIAFENKPAPAPVQLAPGSRARVVVYEPGDWRLRVAFQQLSTRAGAAADEYVVAPTAAVPKHIQTALAGLAKASQGLGEPVTADPADWYVRAVGDQVRLVPASGFQVTATAGAGGSPKQFEVDAGPDLTAALGNAIARIARARNLARLSESPPRGLQLDLEVIRYDTQTSKTARPLRAGTGELAIRAGEWIEFRIKNSGTLPLDVMFLYRDACYGIQMFPQYDGESRIKPGEARTTPRFGLGADPVGWESTIAIGVEAGLTRPNLQPLLQPCLKEAGTRSGVAEGSRGVKSPLERLLEDSVLGGREGTRGPLQAPVNNYVVKVLSWRTDPANGKEK